MHVIDDVFVGSLQELNAGLSNGDKAKAKEAFLAKVAEVQSQLEMDKRKQLEAAQKSSSGGGGGGDKKVWSEEELQMLIKAVNLFPAGTQDRCVRGGVSGWWWWCVWWWCVCVWCVCVGRASEEELQMLIKAVNLFPVGTQDRCVCVRGFGGWGGGSIRGGATNADQCCQPPFCGHTRQVWCEWVVVVVVWVWCVCVGGGRASEEKLQMLIKAVNLFPAGTQDRCMYAWCECVWWWCVRGGGVCGVGGRASGEEYRCW